MLVRRNIVGRHLVVGRHSVWRDVMMRGNVIVVDLVVRGHMIRGSLGLVLVTNLRFQVTRAWFLRLVTVYHVWGGTMGAVRVMGGHRLNVWRNVLRVGRWAMCSMMRLVGLCKRWSVRRHMWWDMLLLVGSRLLVL